MFSPRGAEYMNLLNHPSQLRLQVPFTHSRMYSTMSRPYTASQAPSSVGYEPYQTSEYDRAIQQARERERAAEVARSQSSTPTVAQPNQPPRLPGLNDLFANKLLINPSTREGRKSPAYDDRRRDSVAQGSYFDAARMHGVSTSANTAVTPQLVLAPPQNGSQTKSGPLTIQSLCSAPEHSFTSPTPSLSTSPTTSQSSNSSMMHPMHRSQPTSPYELPPAFFGTTDLAPATYVYQAASTYEGVSYIPGRGPCHMYKGGYSSKPPRDDIRNALLINRQSQRTSSKTLST